MKSSKAKKNRSQILFWVISGLVALSMILGTILTVVSPGPRESVSSPTQRPAVVVTATPVPPTATQSSKPLPATIAPPSAATPTKSG